MSRCCSRMLRFPAERRISDEDASRPKTLAGQMKTASIPAYGSSPLYIHSKPTKMVNRRYPLFPRGNISRLLRIGLLQPLPLLRHDPLVNHRVEDRDPLVPCVRPPDHHDHDEEHQKQRAGEDARREGQGEGECPSTRPWRISTGCTAPCSNPQLPAQMRSSPRRRADRMHALPRRSSRAPRKAPHSRPSAASGRPLRSQNAFRQPSSLTYAFFHVYRSFSCAMKPRTV